MTLNLTKHQADELYSLLVLEVDNKTLCEIRVQINAERGKGENILDMV